MIDEILYAGDTIEWTESESSYSASDGWTLKYKLINSSTAISLTSIASGVDHKFSISSTTSKNWSAGKYQFKRYIIKGTESYTLNTGTVEIKPYIQEATSYDFRSHAQKVLDAIEAVIQNRATREQESITIAGRSLSRTPLPDLIKFRTQYQWEVFNEKKAEKIAQGLNAGKRVLLQFK